MAAGTLYAELADYLDTQIDHPYQTNIPSLPRAPSTRDEVEQAAELVRHVWGRGGGPIADMLRVLERNGVLVMRVASDCKRVDAFSFWHGGRPCVFLNIEKGSPSRSRFDAAHELGHLVMHEDVIPGDRELERQADQFASAFLMPRAAMLRELPRRFRWAHFIELKKRWKVSLPALVRRARDLGCLSEASYRRACIELRKRMADGRPERAEPPLETPQYVRKALELLEPEAYPGLVEHLQLRTNEINTLLAELGCVPLDVEQQEAEIASSEAVELMPKMQLELPTVLDLPADAETSP